MWQEKDRAELEVMSHVTRVNESWCTCEFYVIHTNEIQWQEKGRVELEVVSRVTRVNESWCTCECVMAHMQMSHGTHVSESGRACN